MQDSGAGYVIVDSNLAVDTFTNLVPWADGSTDISPYITWFMLPEPGNAKTLDKVHRFNDGYFQTMVARLYNFDGSMTAPGNAEYIRYTIRQVPAAGESAADVNGTHGVSQEMSRSTFPREPQISRSYRKVQRFLRQALQAFSPVSRTNRSLRSRPWNITGSSTNHRTTRLLRHFRNQSTITLPGIKSVKIFEYVRGARISGDGIIEIPIITNTGRTFVYRQASVNGTFTVPYSTSGSPYDVRATGPYHILGTNRYVNVTENDVMQGNRVSG